MINAAFGKATEELLGSSSYEGLATSLDIIIIVALVVVLIEVEVLRAARGGPAGAFAVRAISIAIPALICATAVVVVARVTGLR